MKSVPNDLVCSTCQVTLSPSDEICRNCGVILPPNEGTTEGNSDVATPQAECAPTVFLRVSGTPYAYRAPPGLDKITVGRQRAKPGHSDGNSMVIRVAESHLRTLRLSRRHLEIKCIGECYLVIDRSSGGTLLNGIRLPPDQPQRIQPGDRLVLAGAITLEFYVGIDIASSIVGKEMNITSPGQAVPPLLVNATTGDMTTILL